MITITSHIYKDDEKWGDNRNNFPAILDNVLKQIITKPKEGTYFLALDYEMVEGEPKIDTAVVFDAVKLEAEIPSEHFASLEQIYRSEMKEVA